MPKLFLDAHGRTICDGAEVCYNGDFPTTMPVLDEKLYAETGDKCPRDGFAIIDGNALRFITSINCRLWSTGLTWELDGEPCHDLIIAEEVELC